MNTELLEALNILEKEKDISKETLLEAIENSLLNACKNHFGKADNVKVIMDKETCDYQLFAEKEVVEEVEDTLEQISLEDARNIDGKYDFIVSNPPYFPAGRGAVSPNAERAAQRTESATVSELCSASARYLKPGGHFFLVHRRKRESDILAALHNAHLTPVRRQDVFSAPGKLAPIFLMEAVKGAPVSAMRCENVLLRGADGRETEEYRKICHWEA